MQCAFLFSSFPFSLVGHPSCSGLSHTLILKIAIPTLFPHIPPLPTGIHNQTSDLHPKEQGQALFWSTPLHSSTSYLQLPLSPSSPVDTPVHTCRPIRLEPLQISRNIPLDPSDPSRLLHNGWRNPSIILSRHPLTGSVLVEELSYVNRRRTLPSLLSKLASLSAPAPYRLLSLRAVDFAHTSHAVLSLR